MRAMRSTSAMRFARCALRDGLFVVKHKALRGEHHIAIGCAR